MQKVAPEGSKIYVTHFRYTDGYKLHPILKNPVLMPAKEIRESKLGFHSKGGMTEVFVTLSDGREALGHALCSRKDNFNRKIGRNIALGRALKELGL